MSNFHIPDTLVSSHIREVERQVAQCRARTRNRHPQSRVPRRRQHWADLRSRIGFALVEAGLRLVATRSDSAGSCAEQGW
jgi:hypothetical protein